MRSKLKLLLIQRNSKITDDRGKIKWEKPAAVAGLSPASKADAECEIR